MASVRNFPWKKVPFYILAQLLGGICGAGIVYANYYHAINLYEGGAGIRTISGTGDLFGTYAVCFVTSQLKFRLIMIEGGLHDFCLLLLCRGQFHSISCILHGLTCI